MMAQHRWLRIGAAVLGLALIATACGSSSKKGSPTTTVAKGGSATTAGKAGSATTVELTATAPGVTADTINVGVSYLDLESLAKTGLVKIDWGPVDQIAQALVDDVNAQGGINGRKLKLFTAKFLPIGNTQSLAACTQLTEDNKVFVVLGGFLADNNLCVVQQHETALISAFAINKDRLAQAKSPWVAVAASDERATQALVKLLDAHGDLKGHTFGIYSTTASKSLGEVARDALTKAGADVADVAVMDAPLGDTQAASAQDKLIAQRMMDKHVDSVVNVDNFQPAADFDAAGFHPRYYAPFADAIGSAAATNPFSKFPFVAGTRSSADADAQYNSPGFAHCRDVWKKATGNDIKTGEQETKDGKSSGNSGMGWVCEPLQIFVAAAKAAGPNLTNESLAKALGSLGKIQPDFGVSHSLGPNKPDAQDQFVLAQLNPAWTNDSDVQQFLAVGKPITVGG